MKKKIIKKYGPGGILPKRPEEVPTRNYIPPLPTFDSSSLIPTTEKLTRIDPSIDVPEGYNNGSKIGQINQIYDSLSKVASSKVINNTYSYQDPQIQLRKGNFTGANIDTKVIDDLYSTAKSKGLSPWELMGVAGQESTLGLHASARHMGMTQRGLMSGWSVDENQLPQKPNLFLANKGVPSVESVTNQYGVQAFDHNQDSTEAWLDRHPELIDQYRTSQSKRIPQDPVSVLDLSADYLKKRGVTGYNPGDPDYHNKVNQRIQELASDPNFTGYLKNKGYTMGKPTRYGPGGTTSGREVETTNVIPKLPSLKMVHYLNGNTSYGDDPDELTMMDQIATRQQEIANKPMMQINDPRKNRLTTGQSLDPTKDLMSGKYDQTVIHNVVMGALKYKQDPYTLAAIALQESRFGDSDDNIGHTLGTENYRYGEPEEERLARLYTQKMKIADGRGLKDDTSRIQVYNGTGKLFPDTESNINKDGSDTHWQKFYGVPIPEGGLDLSKNPLYGKQIIDLRENVLKKNPAFVSYVDSIVGKYRKGGSVNWLDNI